MRLNKVEMNNVSNRFLPIPPSVAQGLEPEPKISDFSILRDLGVGSFGRVYLVKHKQTSQQYAIKSIDKRNKTNQDGKPYFRREIEIMYKIHHENVIHLYSHFEDERNCYFIMEYAPNGNLYNCLSKKPTNTLDHKTIANILKNLISAIYYLHTMSPPIIHRDIKPENVLLSGNNENDIKLTDFGWSNYIHEYCDLRQTFCGTPIYLAPEIILNAGHDEHVDIWCIGVMLFELVVGRPPFIGKNRDSLMQNIIKMRINWPRSMDNEAKDLISKILKNNPNERLSLEGIMKHPYIKRYCPDAEKYLVKANIDDYNGIFIVSRGTYVKVANNNSNHLNSTKSSKKYEKKNINSIFKYYKREVSPLPISKLHLDKIEIIKAGKENNIHLKPSKKNTTANLNIDLSNDTDSCSSSNNEIAKLKKSKETISSKNSSKHHNKDSKGVDSISRDSSNTDSLQKYAKTSRNTNSLKQEKKIAELKSELKEYNKRLEELENENLQLQDQNSILSSKLEKKDKENQALNSKISSLEATISNLNLTINTLKKQVENNNKGTGITRNYSNFNYLANKRQGLTPDKSDRTQRVFMNRYNLNQTAGKNTLESSESRRNLIVSKSFKNNEINEVEKLKTDIRNLKEKYEKQIADLNFANNQLKLERDNINNREIAKYKTIANKYESKNKTYEEDIKKYKSKIRELEQQINSFKLMNLK